MSGPVGRQQAGGAARWAPVDVPLADAEIAELLEAGAQLSPLGRVGGRGDGLLRLSAGAQAECVAAFQQARAARQVLEAGGLGAGERRAAERVAGRGDWYLSALVTSLARLAWEIGGERLMRRLGGRRSASLVEEVDAELYLVLVEVAVEWDVSRGVPVATFAGELLRRRLASFLPSLFSSGSVPAEWRRVGSVARGCEQRLVEELGRAPSAGELQAAVEAAVFEHGRGLVGDVVGLSAEELDAAARAKLVKRGTMAAVSQLGEVLSATAGESSLDAPVGDGEGAGLLGGLVADPGVDVEGVVVGAGVSGVGSLVGLAGGEGRLAVLLARGEGGGVREVAARFGLSSGEVREVERVVRCRAGSPHGQFVFLGPEPVVGVSAGVAGSVSGLLAG